MGYVKLRYRGSKRRTHTNTICSCIYFSWGIVEKNLCSANMEVFVVCFFSFFFFSSMCGFMVGGSMKIIKKGQSVVFN